MDKDLLDATANWLRQNRDKAGTPEFVRVSESMRQMLAQQDAGAKPAAPAQDGLFDRGMHMLGRVGTNMITGPMDMAALAANKFAEKTEGTRFAGLFSGGQPGVNVPWGGAENNAARVPYAGPALREQMGIKEQSPNAGYPERLLENGLNILTGRRAMGITAPTYRQAGMQVAAPTVGSVFGEDIGQAIGGEDGAIIGGILGGGGGSVAGNLASKPLSLLGGPNAGAIYDAGQRIDARVTAGQVGGPGVKWLEKSMGAVPFVGWRVNEARDQARDGMLAARDRAVQDIARGPVGVEPGQRGGALITGAQQAERRIQQDLSAEQQRLADRMGNTPVNMRPVVDALDNVNADLNTSAGSLVRARANELEGMMPQSTGVDSRGFPLAKDPTAPLDTVPYPVAKNFRTDIGQMLPDQSRVGQTDMKLAYPAATAQMREAARFRGLEADFDMANARYHQAQPTLEALREVGGRFKPTDQGGRFEGAMDSVNAENLINRGLHAPERLAPFADHLDPRAWDYVAGSTIARMGQQARGDAFRPDNFGMEWGSPTQRTGVNPQSAALLTQNAPRTLGVLDDVATTGNAYNIPVAAEGLSRAVGGLTVATMLANALSKVPGGKAVMPVPGGILESGPVVRAIAGRTTPIADTIYSRMPGMMTGAQYTLPPEAQR